MGTGNEAGSPRFQLNAADWSKVRTGFLVALAGSLVTFLSQLSASINFGLWTPFITMAVSVVVNILRKWLADQSTPPSATGVRLYEVEDDRPRAGWTTETIVLVLTAVALGLLAACAAWGRRETKHESDQTNMVAIDDHDAVTRAFVLHRQLFAQVCLEAARRERSGDISSEEAENAWCDPRWAAARAEAFGVLADARDRQLAGGWTAERSAAGLEAWAMAADPQLARKAVSR